MVLCLCNTDSNLYNIFPSAHIICWKNSTNKFNTNHDLWTKSDRWILSQCVNAAFRCTGVELYMVIQTLRGGWWCTWCGDIPWWSWPATCNKGRGRRRRRTYWSKGRAGVGEELVVVRRRKRLRWRGVGWWGWQGRWTDLSGVGWGWKRTWHAVLWPAQPSLSLPLTPSEFEPHPDFFLTHPLPLIHLHMPERRRTTATDRALLLLLLKGSVGVGRERRWRKGRRCLQVTDETAFPLSFAQLPLSSLRILCHHVQPFDPSNRESFTGFL